jgi:hypothetical protein
MTLLKDLNIRYEIIGRTDGRWTLQAFDRNDQPISATITCGTTKTAMRVWLMLNGYLTPKLVDDIEIEPNVKEVA